jgi:type VII secretion integral membrane protein EccD
MLDGFGWLAVPLLAVSPGAAAPGELGAAHLFIAALAFAVLTCGIAVLTRRHVNVASTIATLCALGGAVAAARMWRPIPAHWLGMCTLVALLFLLTMAPTISLWAARIRPPYFGSITGRDLFRRSPGLPADAVAPVEEGAEDEVNADTTPRGQQIAAAAIRANSVLTGICAAAGLTLPAAVWATLMPGRGRSVAAAVLAALFVLIFISRGRAFADKRQAIALVCGAVTAVCVGVLKYVLNAPAASGEPVLWGALVLIAFAGAGLAAALLVPITRFTPLVRMVAEWLEIVAIITALPLAAWIGGLFTWVRMR